MPPAPAAAAPAVATGSITGTVTTGGSSAISEAHVSASGPVHVTTVSDASGRFSLALPPGLYEISVTRGGFNGADVTDVAVTSGQSTPLTVTLTRQDLSSLRTIGRTSTSARGSGSTINTGAAASTYVTAQTFANLAAPQINAVLERIPDVTVQHMGSQQDTSIVVGGLQPYETQVLLDGHPLALGQYGVWLSHLFPSYLVGGLETQSGPGNTTAFANIAVGGTANILTPGFTTRTTAELVTGVDSYASQYSNLLVSGSAGKIQYVLVAGTGGSNGPFYKKQSCAVAEDYATEANTPTSSGIVQFCGDMSGSLFTKGDMLKLRYNFTPTTSFEASYVGSFGGYSPQGAAWGNSLGETTIEGCMVGDPNQCTNPANAALIGKTINAYSWYPGTQISNTQQIITAQLRTNIGNNTLLVRPYIGNIQPESYDGTGEGYFPSFFSPGDPSILTPGQQVPPGFGHNNPVDGSNDFEADCPSGTIYSYSQLNSPTGTVNFVNGQEECYQYPYTFYEQDKLYGTTFSFIHPFGDNSLTFNYDFHGQSTFAYANDITNVTVPFSGTRYSTFSLTADLHPMRNLTVDAGLYQTLWTIAGEQAAVNPDGTPVVDGDGNQVIEGLHRSNSHFDPHLAVVFHPERNDSYRASFGTSITFPFVGDLSGSPAYQPYAQSAPLYTLGVFTEKTPQLLPETSTAFGLGGDHRFRNGSVLSADLTYTTVRNVFQQLTLAENTTLNGQTGVLGIFTPINVAQLHAEVAQIKYAYAPAIGLGYGISVGADRSILNGIPAADYNYSPGFPVDGVQLCGNGLFTPGLATCVPYLKSYGHIDYNFHGGAYVSLGVDYEGKNNSYYQPPFAQVDLTLRKPVTRNVEVQVSVQNLLNTNAFNNLPAPNLGTPVVAEENTGLVSYNSADLLPLPPRTARIQLRYHMGR